MLSVGGLEPVTIHAARQNLAVDGCGQGDLDLIFRGADQRGTATQFFKVFVEVRIRRLGGKLGDFRQFANAKFHRVGKRIQRTEPDFAIAGRGVGGNGNANNGRLNHRRGGGAIRRVLQNLGADFLALVHVRRRPDICATVTLARGLKFILKLLQPVTQSLELLISHRPAVINHRRGDAWPGDKGIGCRH